MNSNMHIKIMPFLSRKGNRVAKGAVEFDNFCDSGPCQLVGFTIVDDKDRGLSVLFPAIMFTNRNNEKGTFFILRPNGNENFLQNLQDKILDQYESMISFNSPRVRGPVSVSEVVDHE